MGSHGYTGLRHLLLGSVAESIVRHAHCRVLVVRSERPPLEPGRIVLGDDLTPTSRGAREDALALSVELGVGVDVVHALDLGIPYLSTLEIALPSRLFEEAYAESSERLEALARKTPECEIENVVSSERAAHAICTRADKIGAGLVVVGSHSRQGLERALLGSVAERVVRHAPCSVLIVR